MFTAHAHLSSQPEGFSYLRYHCRAKGHRADAIAQPLDKSRGKVQLNMSHADTITDKKAIGFGH